MTTATITDATATDDVRDEQGPDLEALPVRLSRVNVASTCAYRPGGEAPSAYVYKSFCGQYADYRVELTTGQELQGGGWACASHLDLAVSHATDVHEGPDAQA